jgi:hypothetical protein
LKSTGYFLGRIVAIDTSRALSIVLDFIRCSVITSARFVFAIKLEASTFKVIAIGGDQVFFDKTIRRNGGMTLRKILGAKF